MQITNTSLTIKTENNLIDKAKNKTIYDVIKGMQSQFALALPKHINTDRFVRIAITTIRQNPKLAKCSQESLLGSLMVSAQLGLEPGLLGQSYIIPYGNEAQFQIGYKGMIELLRRSGQLKDIYAYPVYENDNFRVVYGTRRNLEHEPNFANPGNLVGFYSVAILKDDAIAFEYMTVAQIEKHRDRFSKVAKSQNSVWNTDFEEMAKKTVVKKLLKYLPVSVEYLENAYKDEKSYKLTKENEVIENNKEIEIEEVENDLVVDENGVVVE